MTSTAGHEHRVSGALAPADGPGAPGRWHLLAGSLPSSTSWSSVSTRMMLGRMFLRSLWNRPFRRWCDRKAELPPSRGRTEAESRHSRRPGRAILRFCWSVASGGRQESGAAPGGLASLPSSLSAHGPKGAGSEAGQSFCTAAIAQTCIMRRTMASGTDKDSLSDRAALAEQTSNTAQVTRKVICNLLRQQAGGEASSDHFCSQNCPLDPRAAGCAGGSSSPKSAGQPVTEPRNHFHTQSTSRERKEAACSGGADISGHLFSAGRQRGLQPAPRQPVAQRGAGTAGREWRPSTLGWTTPHASAPTPSLTSSASPSVSPWGAGETRLLLEPDAGGMCVEAPCQHQSWASYSY